MITQVLSEVADHTCIYRDSSSRSLPAIVVLKLSFPSQCWAEAQMYLSLCYCPLQAGGCLLAAGCYVFVRGTVNCTGVCLATCLQHCFAQPCGGGQKNMCATYIVHQTLWSALSMQTCRRVGMLCNILRLRWLNDIYLHLPCRRRRRLFR